MAFARSTQPSFNFMTGEEEAPAQQQQQQTRQPLKETLRASQAMGVRADPGNEDLRAQINTLTYELETLKQERTLETLQQATELRDAQNRADAEYRRAQAAEGTSAAAAAKQTALARELREAEDRAANEKAVLSRKVQTATERGQRAEEDCEEARADLDELERQSKRQYEELEGRYTTLQTNFQDMSAELGRRTGELEGAVKKLGAREAQVSEMEGEMIRLRAQSGDQETLAVVKRELSEQVAHIRKLEATGREQGAELKAFRKAHKAVEVVEEEKRVLESKVRMMEDLRRELSEAQLQRQILEDEKRAWTTYLENQVGGDNDSAKFESPEDMARAFFALRIEIATLTERLGAIAPDLSAKDDTIRVLEDEKAALKAELEKRSSTAAPSTAAPAMDAKLKTRLERQRTLAVKEVEYLRAQLKAMDSEEAEFAPESFDAEKTKRINELEDLVDEYRKELQTLHTDLSAAEAAVAASKDQQDPETAQGGAGTKRPRSTADDTADDAAPRETQLRRKNRSLQDALAALETQNKVLVADLAAHKEQLKALKKASSTRVLQLRSNPTADAEALKLSTVRHLREENAALRARVDGAGAEEEEEEEEAATVPRASLQASEDVIAELEHAAAEREKRIVRLKQLWSAKSLEFREAVASILGWKMDFMPNGRVRVTSVYYPGAPGEEGEAANSIVFDGERGTMKVSGGERSVFAQEIRGVIEEWVEGRKCVPGFLGALTCEFWGRRAGEEGV